MSERQPDEAKAEGGLAKSFSLQAVPNEAVQGQPNVTFSTPNPLLTASLPYMTRAGMITVQQSSSWQGPYPSPDAVERFEAVLPGAFSRILTMAEGAQASQIKTTENAQNFLRLDTMRSHYLGAGISVLAVICSTVCALTNHPTAAVALVGIPVMAVARAFLSREKTSGNEDAPAEIKNAASSPPTPG